MQPQVVVRFEDDLGQVVAFCDRSRSVKDSGLAVAAR